MMRDKEWPLLARTQSLSNQMRLTSNQTMIMASHPQALANKNHQQKLFLNNQQKLKEATMLILSRRTSSQPTSISLQSNKLTSLQQWARVTWTKNPRLWHLSHNKTMSILLLLRRVSRIRIKKRGTLEQFRNRRRTLNGINVLRQTLFHRWRTRLEQTLTKKWMSVNIELTMAGMRCLALKMKVSCNLTGKTVIGMEILLQVQWVAMM